MRIVVALGGNALLKRGEPMTAANQRANVAGAAAALATLAAAGHELIITHGNGPQVGLLALQAAATPDTPMPLDVLDAESAGMIGYMLQQELANVMKNRLFATLLTQVLVDFGDRAFQVPTKPIGPMYDKATAERLAAERAWSVAPDGKGWRRVVPSPKPLDILEKEVISFLVDKGVIVICAGGGGIPVVRLPSGSISGVEAVVDKDYASCLLARQLNAEMLLLLTDVDAVYRNWGTPEAERIATMLPQDAPAERFPPGSMGPKIAAAAEFAASGQPAAIGRLEDALLIANGERGTRMLPLIQAPQLRHVKE